MCDETTFADYLTHDISRRAFGAGALLGAPLLAARQALAAGLAPIRHGRTQLSESMVSIATPDGDRLGRKADAFFVHPAEGRHPGIIMWPDIAGLRDTYRLMGRRLAADGYAVLVVNQYYRTALAPLLSGLVEYMTPDGQQKIKPALAGLDAEGTARDAAAFVAFLGRQAAVHSGGMGTCGYCIGGQYAVRTAAAAPGRVKATASLHGANLVTAAPDSPHRLLARTRASFFFAIARNDDARAPGDKDALREAAAAAHRPAEIEVYHADHGWCTLDAPSYDQAEAERAWGRMTGLFAGLQAL